MFKSIFIFKLGCVKGRVGYFLMCAQFHVNWVLRRKCAWDLFVHSFLVLYSELVGFPCFPAHHLPQLLTRLPLTCYSSANHPPSLYIVLGFVNLSTASLFQLLVSSNLFLRLLLCFCGFLFLIILFANFSTLSFIGYISIFD